MKGAGSVGGIAVRERGDAESGEGSNGGAGSKACSEVGGGRRHTEMGENVFIGSNTMLVAPVTVGDGALTGSGSVITKDVPADALAIARATQVNKPGMARKLFDLLRKKKAQKTKTEAG